MFMLVLFHPFDYSDITQKQKLVNQAICTNLAIQSVPPCSLPVSIWIRRVGRKAPQPSWNNIDLSGSSMDPTVKSLMLDPTIKLQSGAP